MYHHLINKEIIPVVERHFGELDKNPPPDEMRRLDAELTRLGKPHEFYFYANAPTALTAAAGTVIGPRPTRRRGNDR